MGLNIGVRVKQQEEGFMRLGCNPKGTLEEISADVREYVESRVPNVSTNDSEKVAYTVHDVELRDGWYVFDVRVRNYGGHLPNGDIEPIFHALLTWASTQFSHEDGIEIRTYWSG